MAVVTDLMATAASADPAAQRDDEQDEAFEMSELESMAMEELVKFLSHRSKVARIAAVSAAAGLSGSKTGRRALIETTPDPLPLLVNMIGIKVVEVDAILAMVNLCQEEDAVRGIIKKGVVQKSIERVLFEEAKGEVEHNASKLLVNLTRVDEGRREVLGSTADGSYEERKGQIHKLIQAYEGSKKQPGDPLAPLALFFENICQEELGAKIFCQAGEHFLLKSVAKDMADVNKDRLLGVAGAIKNCSFHKELHEEIASHREIAALLVLPLVGEADGYDDEDKEGMYPGLASKCRLGGQITDSEEVRKMIYEALTQLCRTKTGREYLRREKVYPVMREVHKFENDFEVPNEEHIEMLELIVEYTMLLDEPDVD